MTIPCPRHLRHCLANSDFLSATLISQGLAMINHVRLTTELRSQHDSPKEHEVHKDKE